MLCPMSFMSVHDMGIELYDNNANVYISIIYTKKELLSFLSVMSRFLLHSVRCFL